jgi:hypothetical protein
MSEERESQPRESQSGESQPREPRPVEVTVQPIGRDGAKSLRLPIFLVVLGLVVAIAKPWSWGQASRPILSPSAPVGAAAGSAPAAAQPPGANDRRSPRPDGTDMTVICASPSTWSIATLQRWAGRPAPIRTWTVIEPVSATGPTDPLVPTVPIAANEIAAIGYCAPANSPTGPPAGATAELYRIDASGAHLQRVVRLEPRIQDPLGILWIPATGGRAPKASSPGWTAGIYIVHVTERQLRYDRWLGADIRITPN